MQLNLPDNSSISEIYRCVMEKTVKNSLVDIPLTTLEEYHSKLVDDLKAQKPANESDELAKILQYFEEAKTDNAKLGKRNLTFHTKFSKGDRYSEFSDMRRTESIIEIVSSKDPTSGFLTNAVGHFGDEFCSGVKGTQAALSEKAETSTLTFEKMLDKGILNATIKATSHVKHDIPGGGYCYAKEAMLSLYLYTPRDVVINNVSYEFCLMPHSYGEENEINLTTLRLSPLSSANAETLAEYEISIIKGCSIAYWENLLPDYKGVMIDQEKDMKDKSSKFHISLKKISIAYFKLEILKRDTLFEDEYTVMSSLNTIYHPTLLKTAKHMMKKYGYGYGSIRKRRKFESALIKAILIPKIKSLANDIIANMSKVKIEIETRAEAFKLIEETVTKTARIQHKLLTEHDLVLTNTSISNLYGHLFEGICKAITMTVAAQQGISLKYVKGDGVGKYMNDSGEEVLTPEFVDAVFIFQHIGKKISVQYKFSKDEEGLVRSVNQFKEKWESKGEDLSNIFIVVPKGFKKNSEFQDYIKLNDKVVVDSATIGQTKEFLRKNMEKLKPIAQEFQGLRKAKQVIEVHERKVKFTEDTVKRKTKHLDKVKDVDKRNELILEIKDFNEQCNKNKKQLEEKRKKMKYIEQKIKRILKKDGQITIPGMDDEVRKQRGAENLLKIQQKEKTKVDKLLRKFEMVHL